MGLVLKPAYDAPEEVRTLFAEYMDMLIAGEPRFVEYLGIQHYDEELADLTSKYGMPDGRLYLAYQDGELAGCVGLRRMDEKNCELKRLYVKPAFRGRRIGGVLMDRILADARTIGYEAMYLDTLPFLQSAIRMYRQLGFYEIACYNDSPIASTIYMKKDLK